MELEQAKFIYVVVTYEWHVKTYLLLFSFFFLLRDKHTFKLVFCFSTQMIQLTVFHFPENQQLCAPRSEYNRNRTYAMGKILRLCIPAIFCILSVTQHSNSVRKPDPKIKTGFILY